MRLRIKRVKTTKAPKAIGPYSQAVCYKEFVFCAGQIALHPKTGLIIGKSIEEQTRQVIRNLAVILESAGSSLNKVLKITVYLSDISDFSRFNNVYSSFFNKHKPARSTVEVSNLPKGALVEIDAIAIV